MIANLTAPANSVQRAAGLVLAVALVIGLATACSKAASTLDGPATEAAVGGVVADRAHTAVDRTTCPSSIRRGKGTTVSCTVRLARKAGSVRVRVRQVDDAAKLDVVLLDAIIDNTKVTTDLERHLKASFSRSFQADCGKGVRVVKPGESFRCQARDKAGRRAVLVRVKDAAGTVAYQVLS